MSNPVPTVICTHGQTVEDALNEAGINHHRVGLYTWEEPRPWERLVAMVQVSRHTVRPVFGLHEPDTTSTSSAPLQEQDEAQIALD